MDWTPWLQFTLSAAIGMIATVGIFGAIGYFRQGKSQAKLDEGNTEINTNTLLKQQIDALESKVNTQTSEIERMSKEIHELKYAIDERDKKFAETILKIQGQDPQMTAFIQIVQEYVKSNVPLLESIKTEAIPTIKNLQRYLDKQIF